MTRKLSEQAQQTVDRTKARFLLVQPDGTIKRKGEWAFNSESYVRGVLAKAPDLKMWDRTTGECLAAMETAVIPPVASDAPAEAPEAAPVEPALGAAAAGGATVAVTPATPATSLNEAADPPTPATPILDSMITTLADGKPRGQRKTRSKKDGKPKALSAKGEAQRRADIKVTEGKATKTKKAAKRRREAA